jgi:hypothetical protein
MKQHDTSGFWKDCSLSIDTSMSCAPFHLPVCHFVLAREDQSLEVPDAGNVAIPTGRARRREAHTRTGGGGRRADEPNPSLGRASDAR